MLEPDRRQGEPWQVLRTEPQGYVLALVTVHSVRFAGLGFLADHGRRARLRLAQAIAAVVGGPMPS